LGDITEQIQHFRLPTQLLDWTIDPQIALFFAIESNQSEIGQFWFFKSPLNWSYDEHFRKNPYSEKIDIIFNSSFYLEEDYNDKIAERNRSFQCGKFTFQDYGKSIVPLDSQSLLKNKMIKYTINPTSKRTLLDYLRNFKISEKTVSVEYDNEIKTLITKIKKKYNLK